MDVSVSSAFPSNTEDLSPSLSFAEVVFNHRSVFPVLPNSKVLQSWWNSSLVFRVYCRPPQERTVSCPYCALVWS